MPDTFGARVKRSWNAFFNRDPTSILYYSDGPGYGTRPDRVRLRYGNERSIISSIYTRIALDVSQTSIKHVLLDNEGRFSSVKKSSLNRCLNEEANIDQTGQAFIFDAVMSLLDEGSVAIVPIDTDDDPEETESYSIETIRTGRILQWKPHSVQVNVYNDRTGIREDVFMPKSMVALVENPFYAVMNEPNSTLKRLILKLNMLDAIDEQSSSGKLDLILQLPYPVGSPTRKEQANERKKSIEDQLKNSKYGIAYTGATEKITQLNRPLENNLMTQIEYLVEMLYSQLGLTQGVFDGTADDKVMNNYYTRTIEPIVSAITSEIYRKFLTKTAKTQGQSIFYFRDPFRFLSVSSIPEVVDKLSRNEIMSPNEFRPILGLKPSSDPKANDLRNRNIAEPKEDAAGGESSEPVPKDQNGG